MKAGTDRAIEYTCCCYLELLFVYIKLSTKIFKDNLFLLLNINAILVINVTYSVTIIYTLGTVTAT